jgi:hypothetical protein
MIPVSSADRDANRLRMAVSVMTSWLIALLVWTVGVPAAVVLAGLLYPAYAKRRLQRSGGQHGAAPSLRVIAVPRTSSPGHAGPDTIETAVAGWAAQGGAAADAPGALSRQP